MEGYALASAVDPNGPSNPLLSAVVREPGGWLANYARQPWMVATPAFGFAGAVAAVVLVRPRPVEH